MKYLLLCAALLTSGLAFGQLKIDKTLCENRINPVGIDAKQPVFTWLIGAAKNNTLQTAYEVRVSEDPRFSTLLWYNKVNADSSVHVSYKGKALASGKKYYWQVRIWDNHHQHSAWSTTAYWQMGLLNTSDWKAKWITPGFLEDPVNRPSPVFKKLFSTKKQVRSAVAYITAHGLYEAHINGTKVGDAYLTPGWTTYNHRLQYQTYDVTNLLKTTNRIEVTLASGWYRGNIQALNTYGKDIALLFQLQLTYTDGTSELVLSDGSWQTATGAICSEEIYDGEVYDTRLEQPSQWYSAVEENYTFNTLVASQTEPVRKHEQIQPVKVLTTPKGEQVIDFGQNLVGWVKARLNGRSGDSITLSHAEVLDKNGNFYTANLRAAKARNIYILDGKGPKTFEPHFSWEGFRYIKVQGLKGKLNPADFTACVIYSDMPQTGKFSTSDPLLNQLQHNITWGQKGNFVDIPSDCPQRDERLGWTADAQVFSRTASFNMDVDNFFAKWMKDGAADQTKDGGLSIVCPIVSTVGTGTCAGWTDYATIIPWNMYLAYGDKRMLADQYASMKSYVDLVSLRSPNGLCKDGGYGDWLSYNPGKGPYGTTDPGYVADCYFAHSTELLAKAAEVLGKKQDQAFYTNLLTQIKASFIQNYILASGLPATDTQTAATIALQFDMLPQDKRQAMVDHLVQLIAGFDNHLTTGFIGTPYICHVLSRFGRSDVAYRLLLQKTYPSWLYPVTKGATTIWERWDGIKPDGSFQDSTMNSFNHYAYGAVGDWMYRVAAGLDTYEDGAGYKHVLIKPHIGGGLTSVSAELQTNYGKLMSAWNLKGEQLTLRITVPPNTTATVFIPSSKDKWKQQDIGSGTYKFISNYTSH